MESSRDSDSPPKLSFAAQAAATKLPKKIDFFALPRAVQDRFLASAHRTAQPLPIIFVPPGRTWVYVWSAGSVAFLVAAVVVTRLGFGDWSSGLAHQRTPFVALYAALFAAAAFCVVRAVAVLTRGATLPFAPGTYVFPSSIIDARKPVLRVYAMRDLESVERHPTPVSTFHFAFIGGAKLALAVPDLDKAEKAEKALAAAREKLLHALEEDGPSSMAGIDPLFGGSVQSPLGPTESLARFVPTWTRLGWAIAIAFGLVVSPVVWLSRNSSSDEKMFAEAQKAQSVAAYKGYLARGGVHTAEIATVLLPRAELRDAEKSGSVDALIAFAKSHRGSKIDPEIQASLRKAMLGELDKAKGEGTVTALRAFATRYPEHKVDAELRAAMHALFATSLESYKGKAPEKDFGAAQSLVQRMLAYAEKSGSPDVEIRFRLRPSQTLAAADEAARKNKYFQGNESLPSRYFEVAKMAPREADLGKALVDEIARTFPADVLAAKVGDRIDGDALPAFKVPTIVVDYAAEWSHTQTVSMKPRGVFVGVNVKYEIGFYVPDGGKPLKVQQTSWRGPELWRFQDVPADTKGGREAKIYDAMADTSFDQAKRKALETLFKMPPLPKK